MEAGYYNNQHTWLSSADPFRAGHDQQQPSTPTTTQNGDEWGKPAAIDLSDFGLGDLQASNSSPSSTVSMQHLYQFPTNGYFPAMTPFNMIPYGQTAAPSTWPQPNIPLSSYSTLNGATSSVGSNQSQQHAPPPSQPQAAQQSSIDPSLSAASNPTPFPSPPPSSSQGAQQSPPMQFSVPFQQQQQQTQHQQHPHQGMHSPVLAMSPVYLMQQQPQQQPQQRTLNPQQLTMQYQFMYHPMQQHAQSSMQTNLTATSSQSLTPPPASGSNSSNSTAPLPPSSTPTPESDPAVFRQILDRLLSPSALSSAKTVRHLMDAIADHGSGRITPDMRTEIASRIRDNAGNTLFAAWARDAEAMVLLVSWLKAGVTGKDDGRWECTVMPLLHVLDRLPLSIGQLREHRLGKLTTALLKSETVSPAIKDMASNISNKWRTLIEPGSATSSKDKDSAASKKVVEIEDKTKKRKLTDGAPRPPAKVAVVSLGAGAAGSTKAVKVKKEKVVVTAVKDAKSDASFFSAPKPKPKLPSFKKAPPAPTTPSTAPNGAGSSAGIAQPNNEDPFQQALKEMKGRSAIPLPSTTSSSTSAINTIRSDGVNGDAMDIVKSSTPEPLRNIRKRKSVSWAPDGHLEKVRIIERAVYDDDPVNGTPGTHSIRDLERAEGAAMHLHLFEEVLDWYEPYDLELPLDIDSTERGQQSEEKLTQEEREKNTLAVLYFADSEIPDSPGEPAAQISIEQVDGEARTMVAGPEIQPFFQNAMSVSDLVGQLRANASGPTSGYGIVENGTTVASQADDFGMTDVNNVFGVSGGFDLSKLDPNALSSLAASLGLKGFNFGTENGAGAGIVPEVNHHDSYSSQNASSGWNSYTQQNLQQSYPTDTGYPHDEREHDRDRDERGGRGGAGFRGRGSGRGGFRGGRGGFAPEFKSKRRCNFYAQGSCRYGDMCHFSHEGVSGQGYYD